MVKQTSKFLLAALVTILISCESLSKKEKTQTNSTSKWIEKTIEFSQELMLLKGTSFLHFDSLSKNLNTKTKRVISIVDATCPTCIFGQLNSTDSLIQTMLDDDGILIFILNVDKSDSASFMVSMQPLINAKGTIMWDSNYYFETKNDLFTENIVNRTFLMNSENEIILVGNPLFKPELIDEYNKILRQ